MVSLLRTGRRGVKAAPFSLGNCLKRDLWDLGICGIGELSECTSHLVEYAANRGLHRLRGF